MIQLYIYSMEKIVWRCVCILLVTMLLQPTGAFAQETRQISGVVSDDSGMPLIGATVQVVGTTVGTATDLNGTYQLDVPTTAEQLIVSYVGYVTQTVDITAEVMDITLRTDAQSVEEIVVIGYGVRKKNDLTGSVASVGEKDFNKGMISSPEALVNGKIAGVQIVNGGGSPTARIDHPHPRRGFAQRFERPAHRVGRCADGSGRFGLRKRQLPESD